MQNEIALANKSAQESHPSNIQPDPKIAAKQLADIELELRERYVENLKFTDPVAYEDALLAGDLQRPKDTEG